MHTLLDIVKRTTDFLAGKGLESPRLQAEQLIGHALGLKRMQLYLQFERLLTEPELEKIRPLVRRRAQREPLQYILGEVEWGGLSLKVDRRALIPRPETEYLLELLAERLAAAPPARFVDFGTGTGALALALAQRYPESRGLAIDLSAEALALARENAARTGLTARVEFRQGSWCVPLQPGETFALLVSNPPYLTEREVAEAEAEVREFEPRSALVAQEEGEADLRHLLVECRRFAAPGAWLALETGIAQHASLLPRAEAAGWREVVSVPDLTGRPRFLLARA